MSVERKDGRTDGRADKAGCRVASHATKKPRSVLYIELSCYREGRKDRREDRRKEGRKEVSDPKSGLKFA